MANCYWISSATGSVSWATGGNWSPSVPVSGDTAWILQGPTGQNIDTGLNQSAVVLAGLFIGQAFLGTIGTTAAALQIGTAFARIGLASNDGKSYAGSQRIRLDTGTGAATLIIESTSETGADAGLEPVRWIGNNASNKIYVRAGLVGLATTTPSETATVGEVQISGGTVNMGAGVTLTTVNCDGGVANIAQAVTTLGITAGIVNTHNLADTAFVVTTANVSGGTWNLNHVNGGSAACTTLNLTGGNVSFALDGRAKTVTTVVKRGGTIELKNGNPGSIVIASFTN